MPSEWAMEKAREDVGIFGGPSKQDVLILAIATELDAARAQGRREGLEEAAQACKENMYSVCALADIRALIDKEPTS